MYDLCCNVPTYLPTLLTYLSTYLPTYHTCHLKVEHIIYFISEHRFITFLLLLISVISTFVVAPSCLFCWNMFGIILADFFLLSFSSFLFSRFSEKGKMDGRQCDQKKLPNVYKSCPKMISLKMIDFHTFTKIV